MARKRKIRTVLDEDLCDTRVVKVRLEPNKTIDNLLLNYTTAANAVYNQLLFLNGVIYQSRQEDLEKGLQVTEVTPNMPTSKFGLVQFVNEYKNTLFPWWAQVSKEVFESAAADLSDAFRRFFDPKLSNLYPTFRKRPTMVRAGKLSVTINAIPYDNMLTSDGRGVKLPVPDERKQAEFGLNSKQSVYVKIAPDKKIVKMARLVEQKHATVQAVTYSFKGGYWWAAVRLRVLKVHARQYVRRTEGYMGGTCGIDICMGKHFATLSTAIEGITDAEGKIRAPKHLRKKAKKLAKAQRRFQQCEKGSNRAGKALLKMQRLHHKVAAERARWLSELASTLLGVFDTIVVENLSLAGMAKRKKGGKYSFGAAIEDGAYGHFVELLQRKSLRYRGTRIIVAHKFFPSSKMCSGCGEVKDKLPLFVRTFVCEHCGLTLDRDVNAARNLAAYDPGWKPEKRTTSSEVDASGICGPNSENCDGSIGASIGKTDEPGVHVGPHGEPQMCEQSSDCLKQRDWQPNHTCGDGNVRWHDTQTQTVRT